MKVLKFGGTSLANNLQSVLHLVGQQNELVCIVVSALGNTTELLRKGRILSVRRKYLRWAQSIEGADKVIRTIWDQASHVSLWPASRRQQDILLGYGELCSALLITRAINQYTNKQANFTHDSVVVSGPHGNATIDDVVLMTNRDDINVHVVPGFYGISFEGSVPCKKTIGPSGSDITAAAVGKFYQGHGDTDQVIIYTDVDGIYTADPRVVPDASIIPYMSRKEAVALGHAGGKVLHPRTPLFLFGTDVGLCVRRMGREDGGTWVTMKGAGREIPLAVGLVSDQKMVTIIGYHMQGIPGITADVFQTIASRGISVSLITQSCTECAISFTLPETETISLGHEYCMEVKKVSIVTIVGEYMRQQVGVAARFCAELATDGINILALSQGSTEMSISAVVARGDGERAAIAAHRMCKG